MPNVTNGSSASAHGLRIFTRLSVCLIRPSRAVGRALATPGPGRAQAARTPGRAQAARGPAVLKPPAGRPALARGRPDAAEQRYRRARQHGAGGREQSPRRVGCSRGEPDERAA